MCGACTDSCPTGSPRSTERPSPSPSGLRSNVRCGTTTTRKVRLFGYRHGRPGAANRYRCRRCRARRPTDGRGGCRNDGIGDEQDRATPPGGNVLSSLSPWVDAPRGSCGERPARPACEGGDLPTSCPRALSPHRVPLREAFETLDKLKRHRSRVPLHRGSLLAFFGCAATLAAFWAVCDRVAWPLSLTAFVTCFDAATRLGTARVPT
jgi:hypothetical protein